MLTIRKATLEDIPLILEFIRELAEYERAPEEAVATPEDLERDGFSGEPRFHVEVAEWDGEPAGFALWFFNYSTWQGKPGLYLEDLFVRPRFRKKGIGKSIAGVSGTCRCRERLRTLPMAGARLERSGDRVLRIPGRKNDERVAHDAGQRGSASEVGRADS
jgi:GNAT superfamily N-acetyltransferase